MNVPPVMKALILKEFGSNYLNLISPSKNFAENSPELTILKRSVVHRSFSDWYLLAEMFCFDWVEKARTNTPKHLINSTLYQINKTYPSKNPFAFLLFSAFVHITAPEGSYYWHEVIAELPKTNPFND